MSLCVCPPAGPVSPHSVSSRPLLQPQLSGADPQPLPRILPLQSEEPDHQDPAGEQVSPPPNPPTPRKTIYLIVYCSDEETFDYTNIIVLSRSFQRN